MNDFLNKIFESEIVQSIRELWSTLLQKLEEKTENIAFLNSVPSKKMLATAFIALISILVLVSTVFVVKENTDNEETTVTDVSETVSVPVTANYKDIDATFLLALTNNDKNKVHSIVVVQLNSAEERLVFSFVDPDETVKVSDLKADLHSHLVKGGISQFLWAISEHTGMGFNRYLIADEDAFFELTEMIGDTDVRVKERISYDHDGISFIIDEGTEDLTADMMLKYYLYLTSSPKKNADEIVYILTDYFSKLLTATDDSILEDKFCAALGLFTTDISAIDFTTYKDLLRSVPELNLYEKAEIN